ncbi:hypothetical protein COBT_002851 [Conglomerata obtusa]
MPITEKRCLEVLTNLKKLFGEKLHKKYVAKASNLINEDDLHDISAKRLEVILKTQYIKYFNKMQGFKSDRISTFTDVALKKYPNVEISNFIAYIRSKNNELTIEIIEEFDAFNKNVIAVVDRYRISIRLLIDEEAKYILFLEKLFQHINVILEQDKIKNHSCVKFNIEKLIALHRSVNNHLSKEKKIHLVYTERIPEFRREYQYFFKNKNKISDYYMAHFETIKEYSFFRSKKQIETVFMKPIIMFFRYLSIFETLQANCFVFEERSYNFLENSFKGIAEMANEKQRKIDGKHFLEKLKDRIESYNDIDKAILGNLLYYHETDFIFRKNNRIYVFLVFNDGICLLLKNRDDEKYKYQFLEQIMNENITKCKLYIDDTKYMLKLIWKSNNLREMTVIPFDEEEKAQRISKHINKYLNKLETTENKKHQSMPIPSNEHIQSENIQNENIQNRNFYNRSIQDEKNIPVKNVEYENVNSSSNDTKFYAAKIEFSDLLFLIKTHEKEKFYDLRKRIIARIGTHFYPEKKITVDNIDLTHYQDFVFFIRENGNLYLLENDDDLEAAIIITNGKLDIVIESSKHDMNLRFL